MNLLVTFLNQLLLPHRLQVWRSRAIWIALTLLCIALQGCGNSQDDMMMRAARRTRQKDADEVPAPAAQAASNAPPAEAVASEPPAQMPAIPEASMAADAAIPGEATEIVPVAAALLPIAERTPAEPLSDVARRQRALDNLEKVAAALNQYSNVRGAYPDPVIKSTGGIPTLSWRVAILPELGYAELYKKFNPNEPWNGINNRKLLDLIPEEYVSPERFDTKTNIQVPSGRGYLFDGNGSKRAMAIEDGAENTLLLLEVDDANAVPWTQPADFPSYFQGIKVGMGNLRGDGTFAVWASGWPVLLTNQLNWEQLHNAFTWEAGDGQLAVAVHRPITIGEVTQPSLAKDAVVTTVVASSYEQSKAAPEPIIVRDPVPKLSDVAEAGKRLRNVFATRLKDAKKDAEKKALANEMLDEAERMVADPASAFALQSAAMKIASTSGGIDTVLRGVDQRVGRFDVDAYSENMAALLVFGADCVTREPQEVDGMIFLRRAVATSFSAVKNDDYVSAGSIMNYAFKFIDQPRDEMIPKSLSLLRTQLGSAKRQFDTAKESLATYRVDPQDGDAAATFGRFLCFIKGDWDTGLPLLLLGGNEQLRELASADLKGAASNKDQILLGDAWWSLAEAARNGIYRQAARDRAAYWYRAAFADIPESLDKLHVKARLDEAGDADKSSPIALLRSLAKETDVDLVVSLASLGQLGRQNAQRGIEPN